MDDAEIERLRKAIRYTYAGSPHKKKTYLAVLEMHVENHRKRASAESPAQPAVPPRGAAVEPPAAPRRR